METIDYHEFRFEVHKDFTTDAGRCLCGWLCWSPSREEVIAAHAAHRVYVQQDRLKRRAELIDQEMNLHEIQWNQFRDTARCKKEGCGWSMQDANNMARIMNAFENHRITEAERRYH